MPVTARLSKLLYDRLGDEVVDELVTWLNSVDSGYRTELRDLNDTNFARFDAKLEQRFAEHDARIDKRFTEFEVKVEQRFAEMEVKFEKRFAAVDVRLGALDAKIDRVAAELRETIERGLKDHTRWMFVVWASLLIPIIGLWMRP